jgi:hypothetical protein
MVIPEDSEVEGMRRTMTIGEQVTDREDITEDTSYDPALDRIIRQLEAERRDRGVVQQHRPAATPSEPYGHD